MAETTHPFYWILVGALGLALLVVTAVRRMSRPLAIVGAVEMTAAVAATFVLTYVRLGGA